MAPACTAPHTGQVAKRWELVGPFRAFARSAKSEEPRPQPSVPNSSDTDQAADPPSGPGAGVTTQPASQPATSQPSEDEDWFSLTPVDSESSIEEVDPFGEGESPVYHDAPGGHRLFAPAEERSDKFWYLDLGFRMGITKLHATKQQLDRRLDLPQKIDVVGIFESPQTPLDRKTDFALTTAYIGLGRRETEWLTWNFYFGSGVGGDRDHQRWLNLNQEVNFNYALYYTGLTVDIYPWGLSQRGQYINLKEHFRASRPYMLTGMEIGYLRAKGWGHFAIAPVTIYADEQKIRDWLFSWLVGFGWEFPINDRWVYNMQIHYTFHAYRPEEYNGWNLTYAIRYEF
jgi:hypothetical protein